MKRSAAALCVITVTGSHIANAADIRVNASPLSVSSDSIWTTIFNTETRIASWTSTYGYPTSAAPLAGRGKGIQVYVPIALSVTGTPGNVKHEFLIRGGYVWAKQQTAGFQGQVSTPTDTALSWTGTYLGIAGFQPFVSLNINAPTGKSALYGTSRFARMDADLVDVPTYGEGLNVGPTVGANIPITANLLATFSAGYTWRGSFDKEGAIDFVTLVQGTDRVQPGDVTTLNASLGYALGPMSLQAGLSASFEGISKLNGFDQYRSGRRYMLNGSAGYAWSENWVSTLAGSLAYTERNGVPDPRTGLIVSEASNSNSNVYRIALDHTYRKGPYSIGPSVSYLYRDRNAYDPMTFSFLPAKSRYAAGMLGGYSIGPAVRLNARVEHVWTDERANPDKLLSGFPIPGSGTPNLTSTGWLVAAGGTVNF